MCGVPLRTHLRQMCRKPSLTPIRFSAARKIFSGLAWRGRIEPSARAKILDLFSRMVVGWALSAANDRHLALRALEQALRRRCPEAGLLHHTDQGSSYASEDYQRVLAAHGITCSMSRRGNAHDNAAMENWFSTMTFELGDRFETHAEAKTKLFDYIEVFYNQERRHSTLGYVSPAQFERAARMEQAAA